MLRKALDNQEAGPNVMTGAYYSPSRAPRPLTYFEVKVGYFRLPSIRTATEDNGWRFRKSSLPDYNSVSAVISRSAHLLEERRLTRITLTRGPEFDADGLPVHAALRLTAKGAAVARRRETRKPARPNGTYRH